MRDIIHNKPMVKKNEAMTKKKHSDWCSKHQVKHEVGTSYPSCYKTNQPKKLPKIFSGNESNKMWREIGKIDNLSTMDDVHNVLYSICCKIQELEDRMK